MKLKFKNQKQNKINLLTKEYDLLTARHANSSELINNLEEQAANLKVQLDTARQLTIEQKAYRKTLAQTMNKGLFSAFYQVDPETGQIRMNNDKAFAKYINKQNSSDKYKNSYKKKDDIPDYLKEYYTYDKNKKQYTIKNGYKNTVQKLINSHNENSVIKVIISILKSFKNKIGP